MFDKEESQASMASTEVNSSSVPYVRRAAAQNITMFSGSSTEIIPDKLNPEQALFIKIIKGKTKDKRPFTAYLLVNNEQKKKLMSAKQTGLSEYEVFYKKFGHDVSTDLHSDIMRFFALRYLDRPIRYIVNDLPLDKEYFTEEDFLEREPVALCKFKVKYLRFIPSKLQSNPVTVQKEIAASCTERS